MATQLFQPPLGSPAWFYAMVDTAKKEGVIAARIELTPSCAAELLRNNPDNRFVRSQKTAQLVSDITAGRWVFNGEPILISEDGKLNDGQHRCSAVIEANQPIETMVTFGLPRSSRTTVDQGAARTAGDYLSMDNVANSTLIASIGRLLLAWERADCRGFASSSFVSAGEIVQRYGTDPKVAGSAHFAAGVHSHAKRYAPPSIIGFCHTIFSRLNPAQAETFMRQVAVGENITKSNPAFAVREGLTRERLTRDEKAHIIIRGWNAFRQNRKLTLTKVVGGLPAVI